MPDPRGVLRKPDFETDGEVRWISRPDGGRLSGRIFSDSSALFPKCGALRAAGWSLVQVYGQGRLEATAFGDVPRKHAPAQQARDAADYAIFMAINLAEPPLHFYADCAGTIGTFEAGRKALDDTNARAHLWGPFFANFEGEQVEMTKTRAHTTEKQVAEGVTTAWERRANAHADLLAKEGAKIGCQPKSHIDRFLACVELAKKLQIYTCQVQERFADCYREAQADLEQGPWPADANDENDGVFDLMPLRCPPCEVTSEGIGYVFKERRIQTAEVQDGSGSTIVYCGTCGAYSEVRAKALAKPCGGPAAKGLWIQRSQLKRRKYPQSGSQADLGPPRIPNEEQRAFLAELAGENDQPEEPDFTQNWRAEGETHFLPGPCVLATYGLDLVDLSSEAANFRGRNEPVEESDSD